MPHALRRHRTADPLASPGAVRAVLAEMRTKMPEAIPKQEKELLRFLYAVRHIERRPASATRRGRPSHWPRQDMISAAIHLRAILDRETQGRVSLNSFLGQYLRLLLFPADVLEALAESQINLFEAAQLARLTDNRLGCSPSEAKTKRQDILKSHLVMRGSQTRLRVRINEILNASSASEMVTEGFVSAMSLTDELLEIDEQDTRHMFWEEMKRLFFAMREVKPEDLSDEIIDDFMLAIDHLSTVLYRIEKERRERDRQLQKLPSTRKELGI